MKKLINFEEYYFDKILEAVEAKQTAVYVSPRLMDMLGDIDHPISDELREINSNVLMSDKVTLLDYDDEDISKFTYTIPAKLIELVDKEDGYSYYKTRLVNRYGFKELTEEFPAVWTKYRNSSTIGKVINKLFPNKFKPNGVPGEDIESFTNEIKAERKKGEEQFERFKIVEGEDIIKYYNADSYDKRAFGGSNLGGSCMRHSQCQTYISFYAQNSGVKLVVLMSDKDEEKIVGRAILWDLSYVSGSEEGKRKFMDRIYYVTDTEMRLFKEFARRNGWLHKESQNMYSSTEIIDTVDGSSQRRTMETVHTFHTPDTDQYPYMDTMKWFHVDGGYLTNTEDNYDNDVIYFLESTGGGYDQQGGEEEGIYVEFYGENIPEDDLTYCRLGDDWRYPDDAIWIEREGEYATEDYAEDHYRYSGIEEEYIDEDDATYSEYHGDYLLYENSVEVLKEGSSEAETFDEIDISDTDPRSDNEVGSSCFEYTHDGDTYYFDDDDEDNFEVVQSLRYGSDIHVHKIWDADRIFGRGGRKYFNDGTQEEMDELIGQKRLDF